MIFTSTYRYSGPGRLDITVKGQDPVGRLYAPTWAMVNGVKAGTMSTEEYTAQYYRLLCERWEQDIDGFRNLTAPLVHASTHSNYVLVCFCPAGQFCHRYLLIRWLQHNYAVSYGGEIDPAQRPG